LGSEEGNQQNMHERVVWEVKRETDRTGTRE